MRLGLRYKNCLFLFQFVSQGTMGKMKTVGDLTRTEKKFRKMISNLKNYFESMVRIAFLY